MARNAGLLLIYHSKDAGIMSLRTTNNMLHSSTGAGAGGSSAAYHAWKFAQQDGVRVNITIFEKTDRIGGRTLTVNAFDSPLERVELGASIFIKANYILYNATRDFNLSAGPPDLGNGGLLVVWDGEKFVYEEESGSWSWWNLAKLFWKYGRAPYRAQSLVQATVKTFLKLYKAPFFPFRSLTTRAFELDLAKVTGLTGEQFLELNNVSAQSRWPPVSTP